MTREPPAFSCVLVVVIAATSCSKPREDYFTSMVEVPAGSYNLACGLTSSDQQESWLPSCRRAESGPFVLERFWIESLEVTVAQYRACIAAGRCTDDISTDVPAGDKQPALVRYPQALAYCAWRGRTLPSFDEWSAAARGGDRRLYPWGNAQPSSCDQVRFRDCPSTEPGRTEVGTHPVDRSPFGAFDMWGSVPEWVADLGPANRPRIRPDANVPIKPTTRIYESQLVDMDYYAGIRCASSRDPSGPPAKRWWQGGMGDP